MYVIMYKNIHLYNTFYYNLLILSPDCWTAGTACWPSWTGDHSLLQLARLVFQEFRFPYHLEFNEVLQYDTCYQYSFPLKHKQSSCPLLLAILRSTWIKYRILAGLAHWHTTVATIMSSSSWENVLLQIRTQKIYQRI